MTFDEWIERINTEIRDFIKTIDEEYDCRMGTDFTCYLDESVIEWSVLCPEKCGQSFYENFISRYPKANGFNLFTLSLLHEVGHLETEGEMIDDTRIRKRTLTDEDYFNLFNEMIATDWAGRWIEKNFKKAVALDKQFTKTLKEFYAEALDDEKNII